MVPNNSKKRKKIVPRDVQITSRASPAPSSIPMKLVIKRKSPLILLNAIFDKVIKDLMALPEAWTFCKPVDATLFEDYYQVVKNPKSLQDMQNVGPFFHGI